MQCFSSILTGHKTLNEALKKALNEHKPTQYQIGRASENDIFIADKSVGRYHARLTQLSPTALLLEDLDSKHGTWVNDVRVARKLVSASDKIRFADTEYSLAALLSLSHPHERAKKDSLDYSVEFSALKIVYEQ